MPSEGSRGISTLTDLRGILYHVLSFPIGAVSFPTLPQYTPLLPDFESLIDSSFSPRQSHNQTSHPLN
jgi:hypothetical protein